MKKHLIYTLILLLSFSIYGQEAVSNDSINKNNKKDKKVKLTLMPFVSYNRTLDFMIGVVPMAMYQLDEEDGTSPSLSGLSAVYTTNGSYFISLFNRWYFNQDKWRAKLFLLVGDKNSQLYVDGLETPDFVDYATNLTYLTVGLQRELFDDFYGGIGYTYAHYKTDFNSAFIPVAETDTNGLEFNFLLDTRSDLYYPTKGNKFILRWITFPDWLGNNSSSNKIYTQFNKYFPFRESKDVLAVRFSGKFGLGDIAFQQQVTIGSVDIRGYSESKYRGDGLMALQGEYRYNFAERLGVVGFAGLSTIYGSSSESFDWKAYPGIGAGFRYSAFKKPKFNIGLDAAVGKDDWGIYFRIGEAF